MIPGFDDLPAWTLAWIAGVMLLSGFVHGGDADRRCSCLPSAAHPSPPFMLAGISPRTLVQAFNFSFVLGKCVQVATWTVAGGVGLVQWLATLPWALAACATLAVGWRLHDRASVETYGRWLRAFMWVMAALLAAQFARAMWAR